MADVPRKVAGRSPPDFEGLVNLKHGPKWPQIDHQNSRLSAESAHFLIPRRGVFANGAREHVNGVHGQPWIPLQQPQPAAPGAQRRAEPRLQGCGDPGPAAVILVVDRRAALQVGFRLRNFRLRNPAPGRSIS